MSEEWRDIAGFGGYYQVSDHGRVRSFWMRAGRNSRLMDTPQRVVRPGKVEGYHHVILCDGNGAKAQRQVHRLVMEAFVGPCPDGLEVCHYDGNGENNRLDNLRYDTRAANHKDAKRHEAWMKSDDVANIRCRYANNEHAAAIAADHNISEGYVGLIARGECYQEYGGPITLGRQRRSILTVADIVEMIRLHRSGLGYLRLSRIFPVSASTIAYMFEGKRLIGKFSEAMKLVEEAPHD